MYISTNIMKADQKQQFLQKIFLAIIKERSCCKIMSLDHTFASDDVKAYGTVFMAILGVYPEGEGCYG